MSGVPPLAFPNIKRSVARSGNPTSAAPAAWSTCANTVRPLAFTSASSRLIVSLGSWLLRTVINPSAVMAWTPVRQMIEINANSFAGMDIATPFALGQIDDSTARDPKRSRRWRCAGLLAIRLEHRVELGKIAQDAGDRDIARVEQVVAHLRDPAAHHLGDGAGADLRRAGEMQARFQV